MSNGNEPLFDWPPPGWHTSHLYARSLGMTERAFRELVRKLKLPRVPIGRGLLLESLAVIQAAQAIGKIEDAKTKKKEPPSPKRRRKRLPPPE